MVFAVAGDVDPEKVLEVADRMLKPNAPVQTESIFPEEPYEVGEKYVEQILPVSVPLFALGFKDKAELRYATDKELLCTCIIQEAFAGEGSALYRDLLDKKYINSSFYLEYSSGLGYGYFSFQGETRYAKEVSETIKEAVKKLHETGISPEDFENARRCIYGRMIRSLDRPSSIASDMMENVFTNRSLYNCFDIFSEITLDEVNERLKHHLDPDNCCLSVIKAITDVT